MCVLSSEFVACVNNVVVLVGIMKIFVRKKIWIEYKIFHIAPSNGLVRIVMSRGFYLEKKWNIKMWKRRCFDTILHSETFAFFEFIETLL